MLSVKVVLVALGLLVATAASGGNSSYIFPCYYVYEPQRLSPEAVPALDLCTHVILIGCTGEVVNSSVVHVLTSPLDCDVGLKKVGEKENTRVFDSENLTSVLV